MWQTKYASAVPKNLGLGLRNMQEKLEKDLLEHGLRTPNEGRNQRYLKNWADVADKICCRHT